MEMGSVYSKDKGKSSHAHNAEGLTYLLFRNPGYCPCHAQDLSGMLRSRGVKPAIVRVSTRTIQVYTLSSQIQHLKSVVRDVLGVDWLDERHTSRDCSSIECLLKEYNILLYKELFWEAHEVGEDIWGFGSPQGQLLAVTAGILAKAQEGRIEPVEKLVYHTLLPMMEMQQGVGVGVNLDCLVTNAYTILSCGRPEAWKCLTPPAITMSYRRK